LNVLVIQNASTATGSLMRLLAGLQPPISDVKCVKSREAAFKMLQAAHFDLVLFQTDHADPQFHETAAKISQNHPGVTTVVLAGDYAAKVYEVLDRKQKDLEAKSQFLSTVSHEMRTPLASLKNAVTVILEGAAGRITNEQRDFLGIARRNVDRLTGLINDVLDFQKLDAGKAEFDVQMNDIGAVVHDVYRTMEHSAAAEAIELTIELDHDLPKVRFDHHKMIQVVTNLVSNAIKFTPQYGKVSIGASCKDEKLIIWVKDDGVGIPPEHIPRIFERFYTVPHLDRQVQGTGLGLAIVKKIVTMHNGRIDVKSQINKGTTFTVVLPLNAAREEADSATRTS